jgi:hypothetical protein
MTLERLARTLAAGVAAAAIYVSSGCSSVGVIDNTLPTVVSGKTPSVEVAERSTDVAYETQPAAQKTNQKEAPEHAEQTSIKKTTAASAGAPVHGPDRTSNPYCDGPGQKMVYDTPSRVYVLTKR